MNFPQLPKADGTGSCPTSGTVFLKNHSYFFIFASCQA